MDARTGLKCEISRTPQGDEETAWKIMDAIGELRPVDPVGGGQWVVTCADETAVRRLKGELWQVNEKWEDHLQIDGVAVA